MKLEDVKVGMRVAFSLGGQYDDEGVVLRIEGERVWCKWDSNGQDEFASAQYLTLLEDHTTVVQEDSGSAATIKADGASADSYKVIVKLPTPLYDADGNRVDDVVFEMQDIIYATVGGEWTLGNIMKACRRAWLAICGGGKAGGSVSYDARKIIWFGKDLLKRFGGE